MSRTFRLWKHLVHGMTCAVGCWHHALFACMIKMITIACWCLCLCLPIQLCGKLHSAELLRNGAVNSPIFHSVLIIVFADSFKRCKKCSRILGVTSISPRYMLCHTTGTQLGHLGTQGCMRHHRTRGSTYHIARGHTGHPTSSPGHWVARCVNFRCIPLLTTIFLQVFF